MQDQPKPRLAPADAPVSRPRPRSEAILAIGGDLLKRTQLPAWAVVVLVGLGMALYTAYSILGAGVTVDVEERVDERIDERLDELVEERVEPHVEALRVEASLIADERIRVFFTTYGCGPELGLLLRHLTSVGVLVGEALPADLKLCLLLTDPGLRRP